MGWWQSGEKMTHDLRIISEWILENEKQAQRHKVQIGDLKSQLFLARRYILELVLQTIFGDING